MQTNLMAPAFIVIKEIIGLFVFNAFSLAVAVVLGVLSDYAVTPATGFIASIFGISVERCYLSELRIGSVVGVPIVFILTVNVLYVMVQTKIISTARISQLFTRLVLGVAATGFLLSLSLVLLESTPSCPSA